MISAWRNACAKAARTGQSVRRDSPRCRRYERFHFSLTFSRKASESAPARRGTGVHAARLCSPPLRGGASAGREIQMARASDSGCLLYTSDAADEEDSVDLGGRRIIKKKKKKK